MKRAIAILVLLAAIPAVAGELKISPGIAFSGFSHPWLTLEATVHDFQSTKLWLSQDGLIVGFRLWPQKEQGWPYNDTLPVFAGFGLVADWRNQVSITGFFGEVGLKLWDSVEIGFSLRQFGASGIISVNLGLSFTLAIPMGE